MKLILHLGMPKTGTTSLQLSLTAMHEALLERGVLYPSLLIDAPDHNFLTLLTENPDRIPGMYWFDIERHPGFMHDRILPSWDGILEQIARHKPGKLILSSEMLFSRFEDDHRGLLLKKLRNLSADISTIIYIRQPSKHYLSNVQQKLKNAGTFWPPGPARLQVHIEAWERALGNTAQLLAYERSQLIGEDSTSDFIHRVLSPSEREGLDIPRTRSNESLSAESMSILQDFRLSTCPELEDRRVPSNTALRRILTELDAQIPGHPPALLPEIADFIDHSSTDLLWLRERSGIHFSGIDYARIGSVPPPPLPDRPLTVTDICSVDPERKALLTSLAIETLHRQITETRIARKKSGLLRRLRQALGLAKRSKR